MRLVIEGHHLPGRSCGTYDDVHVGVQAPRDPADLVPADVESVRWEVEVQVLEREGEVDFRGPAVQGRRGELMLADVPDPARPEVTARVDLTDGNGMPRCARLRSPVLSWR